MQRKKKTLLKSGETKIVQEKKKIMVPHTAK